MSRRCLLIKFLLPIATSATAVFLDLNHRYINFTFIDAGGGMSEIWYRWLGLGRKVVFMHIFNAT